MSVHGADNKTRGNLVSKLSVLLEKVDKTLLSAQQELLLFKLAICPRLTWDLSVNHFPVSWLESTLQPITTKFLKRWSGLAKSADTGCLFLPKEKGGLEPPWIFGNSVQDAASCQSSCTSHTRSLLQPCRRIQEQHRSKCVSEPSPEWRKRTQMLIFVTAPVCPGRTFHFGMTAGPHNSGQLQSSPSLTKCLDSCSTPSQIHYHTMPTCICGSASQLMRVSCVGRGRPFFMC